MSKYDYQAIDAVVNIWTDEALAIRPKWGTDFFSGKMNADKGVISQGMSLEQMIDQLDEANIERAFLIAARSGRPGLPGCYHMPYEVVARAVLEALEKGRFEVTVPRLAAGGYGMRTLAPGLFRRILARIRAGILPRGPG